LPGLWAPDSWLQIVPQHEHNILRRGWWCSTLRARNASGSVRTYGSTYLRWNSARPSPDSVRWSASTRELTKKILLQAAVAQRVFLRPEKGTHELLVTAQAANSDGGQGQKIKWHKTAQRRCAKELRRDICTTCHHFVARLSIAIVTAVCQSPLGRRVGDEHQCSSRPTAASPAVGAMELVRRLRQAVRNGRRCGNTSCIGRACPRQPRWFLSFGYLNRLVMLGRAEFAWGPTAWPARRGRRNGRCRSRYGESKLHRASMPRVTAVVPLVTPTV